MKGLPCTAKANWTVHEIHARCRHPRQHACFPCVPSADRFSELPEKANLSYAQSQSVVKFLIETYGQEKISDLLIDLRDAKPIDTALRETYGFDTDGLEDEWRKSSTPPRGPWWWHKQPPNPPPPLSRPMSRSLVRRKP
jgi:hypothetical protein